MSHIAILHTGSNIGSREKLLKLALRLIAERAGHILKTSAVYSTAPWGVSGQPAFLNQAAMIETQLQPQDLLDTLLDIEHHMGRERREKWGSRLIDIDILFYDNLVWHTPTLQIPHPHLHERNFVLAPLAELAPDWVHPVLGKTVTQLLAESPDDLEAVPLLAQDTHATGLPERLPHQFIVIEGNIGAGKTTLCHRLARDYGCRLILEQFANNPFLPYFYHQPERYAFPVELFFMTERHKQLQEELSTLSLFQQTVVADYFFVKTSLFAKNNLSEEEYRLFLRLFHVLNASLPKPELLVYLHRSVKSLMGNIRRRGRSYEQDISEAYLAQIQQAYFEFFKAEHAFPILILDVEKADFQHDDLSYQKILQALCEPLPVGVTHRCI